MLAECVRRQLFAEGERPVCASQLSALDLELFGTLTSDFDSVNICWRRCPGCNTRYAAISISAKPGQSRAKKEKRAAPSSCPDAALGGIDKSRQATMHAVTFSAHRAWQLQSGNSSRRNRPVHARETVHMTGRSPDSTKHLSTTRHERVRSGVTSQEHGNRRARSQ